MEQLLLFPGAERWEPNTWLKTPKGRWREEMPFTCGTLGRSVGSCPLSQMASAKTVKAGMALTGSGCSQHYSLQIHFKSASES